MIFTVCYTRVRPQCDFSIFGRSLSRSLSAWHLHESIYTHTHTHSIFNAHHPRASPHKTCTTHNESINHSPPLSPSHPSLLTEWANKENLAYVWYANEGKVAKLNCASGRHVCVLQCVTVCCSVLPPRLLQCVAAATRLCLIEYLSLPHISKSGLTFRV